jgi:hypothetical protein
MRTLTPTSLPQSRREEMNHRPSTPFEQVRKGSRPFFHV